MHLITTGTYTKEALSFAVTNPIQQLAKVSKNHPIVNSIKKGVFSEVTPNRIKPMYQLGNGKSARSLRLASEC